MKNKMKLKNKNKKGLAIGQSLILVIAIIAFAFMVGSSVERVSAEGEGIPCTIGDQTGVCLDITTNTCATGFKPGYCLGVNADNANIQCCLNEVIEEGNSIDVRDITGGASTAIQAYNTANDLNIVPKTKNILGKTITKKIAKEGSRAAAKALVQTTAATAAEAATAAATAQATAAAATTAAEIATGIAAETGTSAAQMAAAQATAEAMAAQATAAETTTIANAAVAEATAAEAALSKTFLSIAGNVLTVYAAAIGAANAYVGIWKLAGASDRNVGAMSSVALAVGLGVGTAMAAYIGIVAIAGGSTGPVGWIAAAIAIVAMAVFTLFSYQDYSQEVFMYIVQAWQPNDGGQNCELCNDLEYGCNDYQCHSYGKACVIANPGTMDQMCFWNNSYDRLAPVITPLQSVLKNEDYRYVDLAAVSPGEKGIKVVYQGGCVPPFSGITLGIETDEPAECKIDIKRSPDIDSMISHMAEGTLMVLEHKLVLPPATMPSESALNAMGWNTENGENFQYFIRCKDANGNENPLEFTMEFCVEQGPDLTPPIILSTNWAQESFVKFGLESVPLNVYTNEPADCRWDFQDFEYDDMNNEMTDCPELAITNQLTYSCNSILTGINSNSNNYYYIKCRDQPWEEDRNRNTNRDSYKLTLVGGENLVIDEITIGGELSGATIKDSTTVIAIPLEVKTLAGAQEGLSKCELSKDNINFFQFYNNGNFEYNYEHKDVLNLVAGDYTYFIKCYDLAANYAYGSINFTIETDTTPPQVVRVYKEDESIKITTNEEAECVYSLSNCNYAFEDGIAIDAFDEGITHLLDWDPEQTVYAKCKDIYGNQPPIQTSCSLIVKGSEDY